MTAEEALPVALQVAEALEAAHEKGVIHSDLKPGNVMMTEEGQVKVLDFGLAKALSAGGASVLPDSTTLTAQMTEPGVVLGTAAYMSPEQARGRPVDKRTDIWSFGCLVFEMLTGRNSFAGETASDTLAAILEREPPWEGLPSGLSDRVRNLLGRCLRKDPRDRLRDMGDARIELTDEIASESVGSMDVAAPATTSKTSKRGLWLAVIALVAVIVVAIAVWQSLPGERVVYLIGTTAPLGVYDAETRKVGGTNADDLTDALGSLPVTLVKENSSPSWRREHQVLMQRPSLIVIHLSAFAHQPGVKEFETLDTALEDLESLGLENPMKLGRNKLIGLLGYVSLGSPRTQFIVYSRGTFKDESGRVQWISEAETRFPELKGKNVAYDVPGQPGIATFRDPATADEIKSLVASTLGVD